jgi:ribosome biogenesis GTPase
MRFEDLGYNSFVKEEWETHTCAEGYSLARVTSEHKEAYTVLDEHGEYFATVTGRRMYKGGGRETYPAVGDWVVIKKTASDKATIYDILTRKTILKRKRNNRDDIQIIATNVDYAFVVEALGRDYNLNRFERYFVLAKEGGVTPVAVLHKTDLIEVDELAGIIMEMSTRFPDVKVLTTSIVNGDTKELEAFVKEGQTYCFLGSSGVGKSSLINVLLSEKEIEVQEIGKGTRRGKHTTTKREMYVLPRGGVVIDNPGTREVGVAAAEEGIEEIFDDIIALAAGCKFSDCSHDHEPGCAVRRALEDGDIEKRKYENFLRLKRENAHYEMTELERRHKDRTFGKMVKQVVKNKNKH